MIHDNGPMFNLDYSAYDLKSVRTSFESPNMNSIMERFVETVRREALDNFLIFNRQQVLRILTEFIGFYNTHRPHQGIGQQIPSGSGPVKNNGEILRAAVLGGLHHHYFREAA